MEKKLFLCLKSEFYLISEIKVRISRIKSDFWNSEQSFSPNSNFLVDPETLEIDLTAETELLINFDRWLCEVTGSPLVPIRSCSPAAVHLQPPLHFI